MTFKFVDLEQGSEAWLKWRRFKVGASDVAAIMGDSPFDTPLSLWESIIEGKSKAENPAMQKGKQMEPIARDWLNKELNVHYKPICVESITYPHLIASLDGYDPKSPFPITEIKTMGMEEHLKAKNLRKAPIYYEWQLQTQMLIMGQPSNLFCSYREGDEVAFEVHKNEEMQERLIKETKIFYDRLMNFDPPPPCDRDTQIIKDSKLIDLMKEYDALQICVTSNTERMKQIKGMVTAQLDENGIKRAAIGPRKVSYRTIQGRVDYDLIPELKDVNLDKYRKPTTFSWWVT